MVKSFASFKEYSNCKDFIFFSTISCSFFESSSVSLICSSAAAPLSLNDLEVSFTINSNSSSLSCVLICARWYANSFRSISFCNLSISCPFLIASESKSPVAFAAPCTLPVKFSTPVPACITPSVTFLKSKFIMPSNILPKAVNLFIKFCLTNSPNSISVFFGFEKASNNILPSLLAKVERTESTAVNGRVTAVTASIPL